jgi:hypothetical protein
MYYNTRDFIQTIEKDRHRVWQRQAQNRALRRRSWRREHR